MKTTERFDKAVTKLYNAFHNGELNAVDCKACAVGNICDNTGEWRCYARFDTCDRRIIISSEILPKKISKYGYNKRELATIEMLFLKACGFKKGIDEEQFNGLCAVIEYLCELDNIPNVMDYTKLFETKDNKPKYQLA